MKTLVIIRHAKAEQQSFGKKDFDRELAPRGINDASLMSQLLKEKKTFPDLMISSPAIRALHTAKIFAKNLDYPEEKIVTREFLYEYFESDKLIELILEVDSSSNCVFVFGHNPTMEELASDLCPDFNEFLPTSGIVVIEFKTNEWETISSGKGRLKMFDIPKKYRKK